MHNRVPGHGPKDAKIVLVGEGPGATELSKGKPFVGPAGHQLDRMLTAAGIDRDEIYITNVTKTKKQTFFHGGSPTQWYMEGIIELMQEIKEIKPNVVVPLGNYALWALYQEQKITAWRGSILESTLLPGQKIIPTLHPAYYLHKGGFMSHKEPLGIWDFVRIKEESATPDICLPAPNFLTNPTTDDIDQAVERLLRADHITADTEWYAPERLAYIGFSDSPNWAIVISPDSMTAYRAYKTILGSDVPKWWQNAMFDDVALDRIGIEVNNVVHDTMVMWHSCWQDLREKSLAVQASVLTRHPYYKEDLEFVGQGDERGQIYCATDVVVTDESAQKILAEEFEVTGGRRGYDISMSIYNIMSSASKRGILCDRERLMELKKENLDKADFIEQVLSDTIGYTINCRSAPQVSHLVYDVLGVKRKIKTTRQEVLMDIAASTKDDQLKTLLTAVVRVRQHRNLVSRYIHEDIIDRDGRIRTNWNLAGTRSGRLSTSDPWWNGWAQQTVPDDARQVCIADDGTVFIGWDLAQAEARIVAIKTRDFELLEDMEQGVDIHTKLASQLPFGLTYDELIEKIKRLGKDKTPERIVSKKSRHALNYVMGSGTYRLTINRDYLETGVGISEGESRKLRLGYLDLHEGLQPWWAQVRGILNTTRIIENCFGRRRQFIGRFSEQMYREAVSFEPQSTIADLTTISIAAANPRIKALDPDAQFFAHMHDGGFLQVKEECADDVIEIIREEMTREIIVDHQPIIVPVDLKKGSNWLDMEAVK